ncbi:polynucleotide adenylyltransferase [Coemansia sp. RSA 1813]|nr:polynucleotide adenylyltransferase [Coemansia sp. RSA 1646]KAJ1768190.1 polynucleotide adenylyltransferase [Coemansia sp. RSA 1843]KAJ2086440.1 polynucleotide adenylyltransferase [Coemansia sp. RSA 986]KAJ2211108.1 polynucleotide adenylyltransferase [Coemansia sp. RSA 487]KAJ2564538.1 polynucleotide adenylyltransferase [Coemansia sp. RSA 1813]
MNENGYFGVTPPISSEWPTAEEQAISEELLATLHREGQFESEDESKNREVVLGKIDKLMKEFVYKALLKHKVSESLARTCGGKIFTFGSYRLGAHSAGTDIDTLCVAPSPVSHDDFFEIMVELLKGRNEVDELVPVPGAYVPVIKMRFGGVDIDLTFATLVQPTVPEDQELFDVNLLRNLDETSIRSINGSRVTDEILRLVPSIPTFRLALRCIKLWAKRRAISSNSVGFFGGVAWAMLVARICQLYPNACAAIVVARYFRVLFRWRWPDPVLLKPIETCNMRFQVWNPDIFPQHATHKMPIITPAYPSMCATHNVTQSTQRIIMSEFKRGLEISEKIIRGESRWEELFAKNDFFRRYKYYLQVNVSSTSEDTQNMLHGLVESRVRRYVGFLEGVDLIVLAHPYIKSYDHNRACQSEEEAQKVRDGNIPADAKPANASTTANGIEDKEDPSSTAQEDENKNKNHVYVSSFYVGLLLKEKNHDANGKRRMDLSFATQEFIKIIKMTPTWKEDENMNISIRFLRQSQLPDEVFDGQPRGRLHSSSTKKKSEKGKQKIVSKKREIENGASSEAKSAKKTRIADVHVPSTSGVAVKPADDAGGNGQIPDKAHIGGLGENTATSGVGGDGNKSKGNDNDQGSVPASIPAPVPTAAKMGGIKLKLIGSP